MSYEGMLAVQYHRERVSVIERETFERVREAFPDPWNGSETFISIKMSTLGFEYVAYLNACRRTLDYLALAVASLFLRQGGSIKGLAKTVTAAEPRDLSTQVALISANVLDRFPRLLSREEAKSPRDRAAHRQPVEAAALGVSLGPEGVRIALQDSGVGNLQPVTSIEQMGTNPPLAAVLDNE